MTEETDDSLTVAFTGHASRAGEAQRRYPHPIAVADRLEVEGGMNQ